MAECSPHPSVRCRPSGLCPDFCPAPWWQSMTCCNACQSGRRGALSRQKDHAELSNNAAGSDLCKRKGLHSNTHSSSAKYNLLKRLAVKFRDASVRMNGARVQITDGCFVRERYFHRGKAFT